MNLLLKRGVLGMPKNTFQSLPENVDKCGQSENHGTKTPGGDKEHPPYLNEPCLPRNSRI